jgi:hypothetical protein
MQIVDSEYGFVPDIIGTSCANSLKLKDLDFRVPCGKCLPCQKKRRSEWSLRLEHEYLFSDSAFFITLTYNDAHLPTVRKRFENTYKGKYVSTSYIKIPTLHKKDLQDYIKRLRNDHVKYVSKTLNISKKEVKHRAKPLRYYAVGEYGSKTRRPHYHLILFNMDIGNIAPLTNQWKKGFSDVGTVNAASINYVTKYMFKYFNKKTDRRTPPFSIMSKGRKNTPYGIIGHAYLDNYGTHHIDSESLEVRDMNGRVRRLPKAYLHRLFINKEDRIELSKKSYEKHLDKKMKAFEEKLEKHYDGKVLEYIYAKDSDLKRHRELVNNNETI